MADAESAVNRLISYIQSLINVRTFYCMPSNSTESSGVDKRID
jgi:hypothetical protein